MNSASQFAAFDELPSEVRSLFELSREKSFFTSLPWFEVFSRHALDKGDQLRIFCFGQNSSGSLGARAALVGVQRSKDQGLFKPRKLYSLTNYYSSLYSFQYRDNNCREAARDIARAIA